MKRLIKRIKKYISKILSFLFLFLVTSLILMICVNLYFFFLLMILDFFSNYFIRCDDSYMKEFERASLHIIHFLFILILYLELTTIM